MISMPYDPRCETFLSFLLVVCLVGAGSERKGEGLTPQGAMRSIASRRTVCNPSRPPSLCSPWSSLFGKLRGGFRGRCAAPQNEALGTKPTSEKSCAKEQLTD